MLYRKLHVPVNCFPIFFSIPHSPLSTLLILGKTDVSATVSLISAFITRLSNDCGAYSDLNTTNNNLSQKLGVGLRYDSGTLIDIIINLPQGVQLLTLTKGVGGIPFPADENYIIVFKGTKYTNGAFARIMEFQGNQFDTFKLGMVTWDASSVFWNDVALKSDFDCTMRQLSWYLGCLFQSVRICQLSLISAQYATSLSS